MMVSCYLNASTPQLLITHFKASWRLLHIKDRILFILQSMGHLPQATAHHILLQAMDFLPRMVRLHITPIIYLLLFSSTRIVQHIKAMGRLSGRMLRMLRVLDMERHLLVILVVIVIVIVIAVVITMTLTSQQQHVNSQRSIKLQFIWEIEMLHFAFVPQILEI